jgi:SAM-dependent methyltransferase
MPINPFQNSAEFDAYDRTYDDEVNKALSFSGMKVDFFTRVKGNYLTDIIEKFCGPAADIELLDVGCGIGLLHPIIGGRLRRLAGVDISSKCIEIARLRNRQVEYDTFDGTRLPHPDASFDVAIAVCVFHHVPLSARMALTLEIRRVLRDRGLFVMFEHNPQNTLTMRVVNNCVFDKNAVLLNRQDAEELMIEGGFTNVRTRFILSIPAAGRVLRRLDRLFSRSALGAQYYTLGLIDRNPSR